MKVYSIFRNLSSATIVAFSILFAFVGCKGVIPDYEQSVEEISVHASSEIKGRAFQFALDKVKNYSPDTVLITDYNPDHVKEEAPNSFQITVEGTDDLMWFCVIQYIENSDTFEIVELVQERTSPLDEITDEGIILENEEFQEHQIVTKGGVIEHDEVWNGEILVTSQVVVPEGVTLFIEPGTRVKFKNYRGYKEPWKRIGLAVNGGTLLAVGTPEKQIWFTSDAEEPINGDWTEIFLTNTITSKFDYVIVEFSIVGIKQFDSAVSVKNSIIRWTNSEGLYAERSSPIFENNTLYENGYHEIALEQYNEDVIIRNNIFRNGRVAIHMEETDALVENNYFVGYGAEVVSVCAESDSIVRNNRFINIDNTEFAIFADSHSIITAENNVFSSDIQGSPTFDYEDKVEHSLDYIPGDSQDRYPYVFDDEDETRRVISRIGEGLGFGWSLTYAEDYLWTFSFASSLGDCPDFIKIDPISGNIFRIRNDNILNPRGLIFDGDYFWANDFSYLKLFKFLIEGDSIRIINEYDVPDKKNGGTNGLAYDGEYVLYHNRDGTKLYKINQNGKVADKIDLKNGEIIGTFVWTGNNYWTISDKGLIKLTTDGKPVGEIYAVAEGTWAVAWDGEYLWTFQRTCEMWNDAKIFQIEILDESFIP